MFLIDIIVIFNTAIFDDDMNTIYDRCLLTKSYLKGWFFIDLIAIIPFSLFLGSDGSGEAANLIRFTRFGRVVRMLKLAKLMRLMKLRKQ